MKEILIATAGFPIGLCFGIPLAKFIANREIEKVRIELWGKEDSDLYSGYDWKVGDSIGDSQSIAIREAYLKERKDV